MGATMTDINWEEINYRDDLGAVALSPSKHPVARLDLADGFDGRHLIVWYGTYNNVAYTFSEVAGAFSNAGIWYTAGTYAPDVVLDNLYEICNFVPGQGYEDWILPAGPQATTPSIKQY
jgi:hypothetical protein